VRRYCNSDLSSLLSAALDRWSSLLPSLPPPTPLAAAELSDARRRLRRALRYALPVPLPPPPDLPLAELGPARAHLAGPLLSASECERVIEACEAHPAGWSTKRHHAVPTTDVDAAEVEGLAWLIDGVVIKRILPLVEKLYGRVQAVNDVFVVKYDATEGGGGQVRLPPHRDQSHCR
jgi:hypothetical protein